MFARQSLFRKHIELGMISLHGGSNVVHDSANWRKTWSKL